MGAIFGLHERTVVQCLGVAVLNDALVDDQIRWPTDERWETVRQKYRWRVHPEFKDVVALIDGTTVQVRAPSDASKAMAYYMYKKKYAVNFQIISDLAVTSSTSLHTLVEHMTVIMTSATSTSSSSESGSSERRMGLLGMRSTHLIGRPTRRQSEASPHSKDFRSSR